MRGRHWSGGGRVGIISRSLSQSNTQRNTSGFMMSRLHLRRRKKHSTPLPWNPSSSRETNGRYLEEQPYILPKDHQEVQRLKFQHWMLYTHLHRHTFAPIQPKSVRRILD